MLSVHARELLWKTARRILPRLKAGARARPLLGVDIGSRQIKLVECLWCDGEIHLRGLACRPTPPGAVQGCAVADARAVGGAIRAVLGQGQVSTSHGAVAIPAPSAMVKRLSISAAEIERVADIVRTEIATLMLAGPGSLCTDYQVRERVDEDGLEVILVAARAEIVRGYAEALEQAGLVPEVVDVDGLALANLFEMSHAQEASRTVALVHVGARFTSIVIHSHGQPVAMGDVPAGIGEPDGGRGQRAEDLAIEIERALRLYWPVSAGDRVDEIMISGGGAADEGLIGAVERHSGLRASRFNPFAGMRCTAERVGAEPRDARFAVAAGLAVRPLVEP